MDDAVGSYNRSYSLYSIPAIYLLAVLQVFTWTNPDKFFFIYLVVIRH